MLLTKSCTEEYPQICGIAASIVTFSEADLIMNHHPNKKYELNITFHDDNKYQQKFNLQAGDAQPGPAASLRMSGACGHCF